MTSCSHGHMVFSAHHILQSGCSADLLIPQLHLRSYRRQVYRRIRAFL